MKQNLTGRWSFNEDFGFGKDEGFAQLTQKDDKISGFIEFTENIEDETPFKVRQGVEGSFDGTNLDLKAVECEVLESQEPVQYFLDHWEGILNVNGQLVGHSSDGEGTFGVFVMSKC